MAQYRLNRSRVRASVHQPGSTGRSQVVEVKTLNLNFLAHSVESLFDIDVGFAGVRVFENKLGRRRLVSEGAEFLLNNSIHYNRLWFAGLGFRQVDGASKEIYISPSQPKYFTAPYPTLNCDGDDGP